MTGEPFIYIKQMYMKGFFDLEENCKEKIISEDYWDFIIPLYRDEELKEVNPENACIQEMDFGYKSVSVDRRILLPLSFREYWYSTIPKCYALLDMQPLDAAGIITLQNYPTLQLMGDGIMIGFLDTGIDYQNRVFSQSGRDDTDCGNLGSDDSDRKNTTGALLWNGIYGRNDQCST